MVNSGTPNYKVGIGRLVTDRFDFQNHVDGYPFRHSAGHIDLFPLVTINSVLCSSVQEAITTIGPLVGPQALPDATSVVKGVVLLQGDINGGTASSVKVTGLQGRTVSNGIPSINDVLTWTGSTWEPAVTQIFSASGNLIGTNSIQYVTSADGYANALTINCDNIKFAATLTAPKIYQPGNTLFGSNLNIVAQPGVGLFGTGGNVEITGGHGNVREGGIRLQTGDGYNILEANCVPTTNKRVLSLFNIADINSTEMPTGTGDMVLHIKNAITAPTVGAPNGSILYSSGGKLRVQESNGTNFRIKENVVFCSSETEVNGYGGANWTPIAATSSASYVHIWTASDSLSSVDGYVAKVTFSGFVGNDPDPYEGYIKLVLSGTSVSYDILGTECYISGASVKHMCIVGTYLITPAEAGDIISAGVEMKSLNGDSIAIYGGASLTMEVIIP